MFSGSIPALVTPFRDGALDEAAFRKFVDWQIDSGSSALVPCGTTGESATLDNDEHHRVIALCVEQAAGRVPVIAGAGSNDTRTALWHMRVAKDLGADAALLVAPYYNRPSQDGLLLHYSHLAENCDLPIVLYNVPGRTGVNLDVQTVVRLASIHNIVGVKEASGNVVQMSEILAAVPAEFFLLSGDDPLAVAVMAIGGRGLISVASNAVPSEMVQAIELAEKGDFAAARRLHGWLLPLLQVNFCEANPIPVKAAMAAMGLIEEAYRLPLVPPSPAARDRIMKVLQELKLLGSAARV